MDCATYRAAAAAPLDGVGVSRGPVDSDTRGELEDKRLEALVPIEIAVLPPALGRIASEDAAPGVLDDQQRGAQVCGCFHEPVDRPAIFAGPEHSQPGAQAGSLQLTSKQPRVLWLHISVIN